MPYDEDDFEGPPIEQLAKAAKLESPGEYYFLRPLQCNPNT
jgi:hypothetical protein